MGDSAHSSMRRLLRDNKIGAVTSDGTFLDYDEYGNPRGTTPATRYGWLGAKQHSSDTLAGLTLMGVRLYNPSTGRFLQVDPIPGGSANAYDYCAGDPINCMDLSGRFYVSWWKSWWSPLWWVRIKFNYWQTGAMAASSFAAAWWLGFVARFVRWPWAQAILYVAAAYAAYIGTVAVISYWWLRTCMVIYIHFLRWPWRVYPPTAWPARC